MSFIAYVQLIGFVWMVSMILEKQITAKSHSKRDTEAS